MIFYTTSGIGGGNASPGYAPGNAVPTLLFLALHPWLYVR